MTLQKVVNQFLANGIEGEYADDSARREAGFILEAQSSGSVNATGTLAFTANPADGDTITIGSVIYTFAATLDSANEIKIGSAVTDTISSLVKTINGEGVSGTDYYQGTTTPLSFVSASSSGQSVTLTAEEKGVDGNSIALASSAENVKVTAFAGGKDASVVLPRVGCVFTQSSSGDEYAQIGGKGRFLGVLVNPKMFANYANLAASLELPSGIQGGLCDFGHVFVRSLSDFAPGYVAAYDPESGKISAYVNSESVPESSVAIERAKFIRFSGNAGEIGVLELGN